MVWFQCVTMPFVDHFEIDIISALTEQLVAAFDKLEPGALNEDNLKQIPTAQGVYELFLNNQLVYVGKAANLRSRLDDHRWKILGRQNIDITHVTFKCLTVHPNWTALAPEVSLINYHKAQGLAAWNGISFGPHDPGRPRETTNKPPDGFDAQFPIRHDWVPEGVDAGNWNAAKLLRTMKHRLPYCLRYQDLVGGGHNDYNNTEVHVPEAGMTAEALLRLIAQSLPPGWQATRFPSHMILYKENTHYIHGVRIWPVP